jgi:DNA-binding response OmpR family regulator
MTSVYGKASSLAERRMQPSELLTVKESAGRILYVEDDEDTRELVTCVMKMNNYRIAAAENCHDALMLARSNEFDLYLIDNWIAECSGIDLCEKLREFDPFVPILFYSGAAYEHDKQRAFAAGAQGYLVKPVDNDELLKELSRLISAARRTQSVTE